MGIFVAIEGADGVGKHTAATGLRDALVASGRRATVIGFPRYGETLGAVMIGRLLAGEIEVPAGPQAAAVLYALDRLESLPVLRAAEAGNDVVILDRYIASNIAYQAARLGADAGADTRPLMDWILALETGQFALPRPALSIYLDTPWDVAKALILRKAQRSYTDRAYDEYEADAALQLRVRASYEAMVAAGLLGPWQVVQTSENGEMRAPGAIAAEIAGPVAAALS